MTGLYHCRCRDDDKVPCQNHSKCRRVAHKVCAKILTVLLLGTMPHFTLQATSKLCCQFHGCGVKATVPSCALRCWDTVCLPQAKTRQVLITDNHPGTYSAASFSATWLQERRWGGQTAKTSSPSPGKQTQMQVFFCFDWILKGQGE